MSCLIKPFTLGRFNEITNIVRKGVDIPGQLNIGDIFECSQELAEYLTGKNDRGMIVVKVIEVIPYKVIEEKIEELKQNIAQLSAQITSSDSESASELEARNSELKEIVGHNTIRQRNLEEENVKLGKQLDIYNLWCDCLIFF